MQKRSGRFEIRYHPVPLEDGFPLQLDPGFVQRDQPIRYLHVHQCLEIGICLQGSGVFMVGEKLLPFSTGDVSFINHTEVHLARSAAGTTSEWTWIYLDPLKFVDSRDEDRRFLDPTPLAGKDFDNMITSAEEPVYASLVRRLIGELREQKAGFRAVARGLILELMVLTHRLRRHAIGHRTEGVDRPGFERIAPALQMIARDYASPLRVADLARQCGVSEPGLRRLFRQAIGRSPRDYWNGFRLRVAASRLRASSRSILEISQEVGFDTLSSFNRLFRLHFGNSPRRWREIGVTPDQIDTP